jgi:hypothetical protein
LAFPGEAAAPSFSVAGAGIESTAANSVITVHGTGSLDARVIIGGSGVTDESIPSDEVEDADSGMMGGTGADSAAAIDGTGPCSAGVIVGGSGVTEEKAIPSVGAADADSGVMEGIRTDSAAATAGTGSVGVVTSGS